MSSVRKVSFPLILSAIVTLSACVQYPTEKAGVVDLRPQISFRMSAADAQLQSARVFVNGLDVGVVGEYLEGQASLRVLAGKNVIQVVSGGRVVLDQQVYLGDGVGRTLLIN